jgi:glutamyl-Q tRNA(Asp) synthetase
LGSLYTALASFLRARAQDGEWFLRIDDIDSPRTVPSAADSIRKTLEQHGLYWDGSVVFQSVNLEAYQRGIEELAENGLLYACTCSRRELIALNHTDTEHFAYPGLCRLKNHDRAQPHALRIKVNAEPVAVVDQLQGTFQQDLASEVGDFIVRRRDGIYAYHLATVLDDDRAEITEIVRGIDLLESTPRQIYLQRRLGLTTPNYLHLPVIVDAQGQKLSKQTGALPVTGDHPSRTLFCLLNLLNQSPPLDLQTAPPAEILS